MKWRDAERPNGRAVLFHWALAHGKWFRLLLYYKQITCRGWNIPPGQPCASHSLAVSVNRFFPLFVYSPVALAVVV